MFYKIQKYWKNKLSLSTDDIYGYIIASLFVAFSIVFSVYVVKLHIYPDVTIMQFCIGYLITGVICSLVWPIKYFKVMTYKDWKIVAKDLPFTSLFGPIAILTTISVP